MEGTAKEKVDGEKMQEGEKVQDVTPCRLWMREWIHCTGWVGGSMHFTILMLLKESAAK